MKMKSYALNQFTWFAFEISAFSIVIGYFQATAEISLQHLVNRKVDEYKKRLGSCTDRTQAENEESKILKEFENAREMKLGTKKMRGSFKQQLTQV